MNKINESLPAEPKSAHGSVQSYVTGFILSLFFTINAYYLVVNKTVTGNALLGTILVFAVLQMLVQIFFFLHLGRGPKPLYNVIFFAGTVGLILVVVLGSIFIMNNLHYNMVQIDPIIKQAQEESIAQVGGRTTGACQAVYTTYKVKIADGKINPSDTTARRCDTLIFINEDDREHTIVFGTYPAHQSYAGHADIVLRKGYPKSITLNQTGAFLYYDESNTSQTGQFTVVN